MDSQGSYIRVWNKLNLDEVSKHLLLIDDLYGTCGNCKHLGLNYTKDKTCPNCQTEFRYIGTSSKNPSDIQKILARIEKDGLEFLLIDREDFNRSRTKDAAKDLFKSE